MAEAVGRFALSAFTEPDKARCGSMSAALKDTVRLADNCDNALLLSAARRITEPRRFRKYNDKRKNVITNINLFERIDEATEIKRALANKMPMDLRALLGEATDVLLDFSMADFSDRSVVRYGESGLMQNVTMIGGDLTGSVWNEARVEGFNLIATKLNGSTWTGGEIYRCSITCCPAYAIGLVKARIHHSLIHNLSAGFANTDELVMENNIIQVMKLGDFPRKRDYGPSAPVKVYSSIVSSRFLDPALGNTGAESIMFDGEALCTESQKKSILAKREMAGHSTTDIRYLLLTAADVHSSANPVYR